MAFSKNISTGRSQEKEDKELSGQSAEEKIRRRRCSGTSYRRTTLGCLSSFSVAISVFICATAATNEQARRKNPGIDPWIGQKGGAHLLVDLHGEDVLAIEDLDGKGRPVSACRASLTLPKCPSPSVRPISYLPIRIAPSAAAMPAWVRRPTGTSRRG
ncbi:hypothetical protein D1007_23927 [Hordeum vulgare]|nr:hypothetical protein D1007_23927 [Hordeum vulgare]